MSRPMQAPYYPIIYVRGFAATMSEIDETTADPYMGFNRGSSVLRQDHQRKPVSFIFESPLLRLIKDHNYIDAFQGGGYLDDHGNVPARSVWVFRYYERASNLLGSGERVSMEQFALDLRRFILRVRDATCGDDPDRKADFKVHLVAHSMGGLVSRCYLQNICRHGVPAGYDGEGLELTNGAASPHYVEKLFTYGTPHNGIDVLGLNVPDLGPIDKFHVSNFAQKRMREYLKISKKSVAVNSLDGALDPDKCFCFVGSDYKDYDAFFKLSKQVTGPASDGLVMMANAYVEDAPRAVSYRSHSGHFGLVNSEAGYQNLRRFLFGSLRITAMLHVTQVDLPPGVQAKYDNKEEVRGSYYFDTVTRVRAGPNYVLNERRYEHSSALLRSYDELIKDQKPVYLFTGYLTEMARHAADYALMFSIDVGVRVPLFEVNRKFWFDEHFEGFMYQEQITLAIRDKTIRYGLSLKDGIGSAPHQAEIIEEKGQRQIYIVLGTASNARPGFQGQLQLIVDDWQ
ncbi:alpha/beta hydrolase [Pseudomonas sp. C27(2019)]|uniref:esterase/lipase family protein n=1 Tax=Pseudomonas sp. C27(2019) TaxID=2604941 RepID=UPI00124727E2|nr:alpha/beta hydrolase [Pseudomonas sp. C27(2019)]QEY58062.1 alpha/beta hydrolase [Pseudomonas sp. C27(2019)]